MRCTTHAASGTKLGALRCIGMMHNLASRQCAGGEWRMQNSSDDTSGERPLIGHLFEHLARDGRAWAEAEVKLARLELAELKSQALKAAGLAAIGLGSLLCGLLALTQAAITALSAHVPAPGLAGLIVATGLALCALACGLAAWRTIAWRTESVFFRWLGSSQHHGRS